MLPENTTLMEDTVVAALNGTIVLSLLATAGKGAPSDMYSVFILLLPLLGLIIVGMLGVVFLRGPGTSPE